MWILDSLSQNYPYYEHDVLIFSPLVVHPLSRHLGLEPPCLWAGAGECLKNPLFMLGDETVGNCIKSCCSGPHMTARGDLSVSQRVFCDSCGADGGGAATS